MPDPHASEERTVTSTAAPDAAHQPTDLAHQPTEMSVAGFCDLLDRYGANEARWPDERRAPARALLARSADARRARHEAARLDTLLDAAPAAVPSPTLTARIMDGFPPRTPRWQSWLADIGRAIWPDRGAWKPAAAFASAALLGLMVGVGAPADWLGGGGLGGGTVAAFDGDQFDTLVFGATVEVDFDS